MKIQLDTTRKTIKIDENVKISSFINLVKKLLPDNEWKDYTLESNTVIYNWHSPIVIDRWKERELYPWRSDRITYYAKKNEAEKYEAQKTEYNLGMKSELNGSVYSLEVADKLI